MRSPQGGEGRPAAAPIRNSRNNEPTDYHDGRKLAVRFFRDRLALALLSLSADQFVAWVRLSSSYVQLRGDVQDDDRLLARLSGLSLKRWQALRLELIGNGLAEGRGGRWIDVDQDVSIQAQLRFSQRQRAAAAARWARERRHA